MSNTLIVRDAVALVCGETSVGADLAEHLRARIAAARTLPGDQVEECFAVLAPESGEDAPADLLQAALILAVAHPHAAAKHKLLPAVLGRRLAVACEKGEDVDAAFAVLHFSADLAPGHSGVERATASLMRRQGMVQELVDRYLERAQRLLDEGEHTEAIPWLREVLLLDRSRKDVARMIRDLRFDEVSSAKARRRRFRIAGVALAFSLALSVGVLREIRLRREFGRIQAAKPGDLPTLNARLAAVETFVSDNPVWHGALSVLKERTDMRVQIERIIAEEAAKAERDAAERERHDRIADSSVILARSLVSRGEYAEAIAEFQKALELGSPSWPWRERTERDVEALKEHLAGEGS
jgi:tetratricopeptide (TPR) repeat protein